MTIQEAKQIIAEALGLFPSAISIDRGYAKITCSMNVTYDQLSQLAERLGTRVIYLTKDETPGYPGSFEVSINLLKLEEG